MAMLVITRWYSSFTVYIGDLNGLWFLYVVMFTSPKFLQFLVSYIVTIK